MTPLSAFFETNVRTLAGVGPSKAEALGRLGIHNFKTLLYHFPRAYELRGNIKPAAAVQDGEVASLILTVASPPRTARLRGRMTVTKLSAFDETGSCSVSFFNAAYVQNVFHTGDVFRFYGRISKTGRRAELINPKYDPVTALQPLPPLYPVYPLTEGISSKLLYTLCGFVLDRAKDVEDEGDEILPRAVREQYGLCGIFDALSAMHRPASFEELEAAKKRLIFEEIFLFVKNALTAREERSFEAAKPISKCDFSPFVRALPYELTGAQKRTVNEIYKDMTSGGRPMRRMVSGDVGSGKTICAAAAAYLTVKSGGQCAVMAPTEILAKQHYADFDELFSPLGVRVALLTGSLKKAEKDRVWADLAAGGVDIVVGTHALITERVEFKNLSLAVCDEQHRFGVAQRDALLRKGVGVHSLVMSATPIPRTLAQILFADLDVSVIDEMPPGRQKVSTYSVDESYRERLNRFIRSEVSAGRQVYIVCPAVEEESEGDMPILPVERLRAGMGAEEYLKETQRRRAVTEYAEKLQKEVFPDLHTGYLHGKMKAAEKDAIMASFLARETDILVSTTVIEVGVNVPNATLMIVEGAEFFGLSQLHQLRGRVGRGKEKAYCVLVHGDCGEDAMRRLDVLCKNASGYKIAEYDLKERGPGDFFRSEGGTIRQHGGLRLRLAGMAGDTELFYAAVHAAQTYAAETNNL